MKKLLIIDGNSILNRAYYGIRPLTAPDGTPTNAVYGFLNILFKYLEEEAPDYLCVAFDVKEKTFRHKKYELYKAQRKPAPEDFLVQLPLIKEVLSAMNCLCLELAGYEADDIIGTISRLCDEGDVKCRILTGDKDDLQLASKNTVIKLVVTAMGKTTTTDYDSAAFTEKYGVEPDAFIDIKALMGDSSDNIPGVKGIGEKTAMSLIQSYGSIDTIYNEIDSIEVTDSVRKKLADGKDSAYLSRELATIDKNVPIEFDFSLAEIKGYDNDKLAALFSRLNFRSFLQKLDLGEVAPTEEVHTIDAKGRLLPMEELIAAAEKSGEVCYTITNNVLCIKPKGIDEALISKIADRGVIADFLANEKIAKIGFNIKEDIISASECGIDFEEINAKNIKFDVMLAAYILDPTQSEYRLDDLCKKYLNATLGTKSEAKDCEQISMLDMISGEPEADNTDELSATVFALEQLFAKTSKAIEENGQHMLYYNVELPLLEVLADLQLRGMYIDKKALSDFGEMLDKEINTITEEIYSLSGEEFNINSPKQLGVILFEKLSLPYGKKNKRGSYSTNVDVLEKLRDIHPIADKVLKYRQLAKLQSTYVVGLGAVVNPKTGRIHSRFNQMVTTTGRISSTEPNMQNIPVRTELGRELRRMFIAERPDWCLIDADYSQIELRVLAHIADDEAMKSAFASGDDIHTQTAATVFGVNPDEVTSQMRSRAKAVNFGIVYGIGAFSRAQDIGTTRKEAEQYINDYLHHYSNVSEYMKSTIADAKSNGYIRTILSRRRYIPELNAGTQLLRAFGERVAMNAPIQGSAADIIKIAMVNVYKRLKAEGLSAKLVLQVHDELIVEAPEAERELAGKILKEEMESAYALSVPLVVDMNFGKSWYDTK
ncbi:MAG: DNA polymerase I [Clostridia bacterium]|nr:DNA polymerase I [Clostridia bacterium]